MRAIILIVAVLLFGSGFFESHRRGERSKEQVAILVELESLNHPQVSKLVDEWREYYPNPTSDRLAELRILAQRVKNDPAAAEQFLAGTKDKKLGNIDLYISSPFGSLKSAPGL
jgi:hypothetical protein